MARKIEIKRIALIAGVLMFFAVGSKAAFVNLPGMDFVIDRVKNNGYLGQAWDLKARPHQTAVLTLNDNGPIFFALGIELDAIDDLARPLGAMQYDALHLWRQARKWKFLSKMEMMKLPDDWKLLVGPMANGLATRPDKLRLDRDILFNASFNVPFGGK